MSHLLDVSKVLDRFSKSGPYSVWKQPRLCHCPWFQWISLVWMHVLLHWQEQRVGAAVEEENSWFPCVDSFSLVISELNKLKRDGTGTQACFSDHVYISRFSGHYMTPQQPVTQPCDLPLSCTVTVLQRHLVPHTAASNPGELASVWFCCTELNSHWFCKEKKCLHAAAVAVRPTDRRGGFDP